MFYNPSCKTYEQGFVLANDMQTLPPPHKMWPFWVFSKKKIEQCSETNEKSIFLFLVFEILFKILRIV